MDDPLKPEPASDEFMKGYYFGSTFTRYLILGHFNRVDGERDLLDTLVAIARGDLTLTPTAADESEAAADKGLPGLSDDAKDSIAITFRDMRAEETKDAERLLVSLLKKPEDGNDSKTDKGDN